MWVHRIFLQLFAIRWPVGYFPVHLIGETWRGKKEENSGRKAPLFHESDDWQPSWSIKERSAECTDLHKIILCNLFYSFFFLIIRNNPESFSAPSALVSTVPPPANDQTHPRRSRGSYSGRNEVNWAKVGGAAMPALETFVSPPILARFTTSRPD